MEILASIEELKKYYGIKSMTKALDGISFSIYKGEMLAIMGPSGSGKSTLLNILSTIDTPTLGEVYVNDKCINKMSGKLLANYRKKYIGFIFQDLNLLDTLTLRENVELVLNINRRYNPEEIKRMDDLFEKLEISHVANSYPYEVSGGQRQRCACIRAIINNPQMILADEPTGALDSHAKKQFLSILKELNRIYATTIIIVTHDAFVAKYCDRVLFIRDGVIFNEINNDDHNDFYKEVLKIAESMSS